MIQYEDGRMTITCDDCGTIDYYDGSWQGCLDSSRDKDWISIHDDKDGWLNFCCCECKDDYFSDSRRDED